LLQAKVHKDVKTQYWSSVLEQYLSCVTMDQGTEFLWRMNKAHLLSTCVLLQQECTLWPFCLPLTLLWGGFRLVS